MAGWYLDPTYAGLRTEFGDLASVFALEGKRLTRDPQSEVVLIERDGVRDFLVDRVKKAEARRR